MTGHGGSDGLHGYVPSLDYVVEDIVSLNLRLLLHSDLFVVGFCELHSLRDVIYD